MQSTPESIPPQPAAAARPAGRWVVVAIALVCLLPLLAALYFRFVSPPSDLRMAGEALAPRAMQIDSWKSLATVPELAAATPAAALNDHWLILHTGPGQCDSGCQDRLHLTKQVRTAQYKSITRVQRVWLVTDAQVNPAMLTAHPDLLQVSAAPDAVPADLAPDSIYLIDRRAYLVFRYAADVAPKEFIRDLEKLVKF